MAPGVGGQGALRHVRGSQEIQLGLEVGVPVLPFLTKPVGGLRAMVMGDRVSEWVGVVRGSRDQFLSLFFLPLLKILNSFIET